MTLTNQFNRAERLTEAFPGADLDELVPRGVAYREVYAKFGRVFAERTLLTQSHTRPGSAVRSDLSEEWQQAGYIAAARIAHDIFVSLGNWMRSRADLLPEPVPAPEVVDVEAQGRRL